VTSKFQAKFQKEHDEELESVALMGLKKPQPINNIAKRIGTPKKNSPNADKMAKNRANNASSELMRMEGHHS
jgi:hypothetical protein